MKTRVFQYAFSGLSSKLEVIARLSALTLNEYKNLYGVTELDDLLEADDAYFFHNLFAKLRYFAAGMSDKHVHLCLVSLKDYAPRRLGSVLIQLLELIGKNIDSAMLLLDSAKIMQALDCIVTLTAFIDKEAAKPTELQHLPASADDTTKKIFQQNRERKALPNMLRRLLLRVQPYISPTNSSP